MAKAKAKPSLGLIEELMAEKSAVLSKARALTALEQTVQPLWASAASLEERIASLLDAYGDDLEAAVPRISAASCNEKAGDPRAGPPICIGPRWPGRCARSPPRKWKGCWPSVWPG